MKTSSKKLWQGLLFFALSFGWLALSRQVHTRFSTTFPFILSWIGIIYILEWADARFLGKTFSEDLAPRVKHRFLRIALVAIPFGIIIELFGVYFLRLWYY